MIIYKATSPSGKIYIGQTIQELKNRIKSHKSYAKNGSNTYFYRAVRKYGFENFKWEIIDKANTQNELNKKEVYWIEQYKNNLYNTQEGGRRNKKTTKGYKHTKEHKKKIGDSARGRKHTEETKKLLSVKKKGTTVGVENGNWNHNVDEKQIIKLRKLGLPTTKISKITGVHISTVNYRLKKYGLNKYGVR